MIYTEDHQQSNDKHKANFECQESTCEFIHTMLQEILALLFEHKLISTTTSNLLQQELISFKTELNSEFVYNLFTYANWPLYPEQDSCYAIKSITSNLNENFANSCELAITGSKDEQDLFIKLCWQPFVEHAAFLLKQVITASNNNVELNKRMPSQNEIYTMLELNMRLTKVWHGSTNISLSLYYFHQMAQAANLNFYTLEDLKVQQSVDGFITKPDTKLRYAYQLNYQQQIIHPHLATGGFWGIKNSAIDDVYALCRLNIQEKQNAVLLNLARQLISNILAFNAGNIQNWGQLPFPIQKQLFFSIENIIIANFNLLANVNISYAIIEECLLHRFILTAFKRHFPLQTYVDGDLKTIYAKGNMETSRVRINQMPYKPLHCLAITPNNTQLEVDKPLDNLTLDIEKILHQVTQVNPKHTPLPQEKYLDVMQNSNATCTIKETQHLHISKSTIHDHPGYAISFAPQFCPAINATIDCICLGNTKDALFLKINCQDPTTTKLLEFLIGLKLHLQQQYNGNIDFNFHAIPQPGIGYTIIFHPLAHLEKRDNYFINTDTKEKLNDLGLTRSIRQKFNIFPSTGWQSMREHTSKSTKFGCYQLVKAYCHQQLNVDL